VDRETSTAESLKQRGLTPKAEGGNVSVDDPDGNVVLFRAVHQHAKL